MWYLDAVIPVMYVELLVDRPIDQIVHPDFEHDYELLRFQKRHEVSNVLPGKFCREPKDFCKSNYFVIGFNAVRRGVHLVS